MFIKEMNNYIKIILFSLAATQHDDLVLRELFSCLVIYQLSTLKPT